MVWSGAATLRDGRKIGGKRWAYRSIDSFRKIHIRDSFAHTQEMDKHPFFMKEPPKPGDELHPLLEGIQQLKYDPMENTLEDLATTYKEDGNFDMKNKKYRMAIFSYTEGLHQKCTNDEINASLYNNRSAAHFFLKNYRWDTQTYTHTRSHHDYNFAETFRNYSSSFIDAKKAIALKPTYEKAELRMAQCTFHLKRYEECIDICNKFIEKYGQNEKIVELRRKARETHLQLLRDQRKEQTEQRRKGETLKRTIDELKARNIKFEEQVPGASIPYEQLIRPHYLPLEEFPIQMTESMQLRWPAVFCYPEFTLCDFQQQLTDDNV